MINISKWVSTMFMVVTISSCASTAITGSWKDKDYTRQVRNVLVIGMSKEMMRRRLFEESLVEQFKSYDISAVSSAEIFPSNQKMDKESLSKLVQEKSFDAVIVTRLISVDKEQTYVPRETYVPPPGYRHGYYGYYQTVYPSVYSEGYLRTDTVVSLATNLYDTIDEKLVWSITSESFNPTDINRAVKDIASVIVEKLSTDGII